MSNKPIIVKFIGPNPSIEVVTIGHFTDNLVNDVTFEFNRYIGDIDLAQFYCMLHIENLGATLLQTKVSDSKLQAVLTVTTDITNFPGAHTASIKFVRDTGNLQYVWTTRNFDLIVERRIDLDKEIQHIDPTPLAGFIINLAANTARINDLEESKLDKPQEIQAGTFPKVTINQYGLVTEGHDLSSEDIPPIPISRVSGLTEIVEGKSRARVFATESALNTWLSNPENKALLQIGDNFYIEETDKPDYWWNGTTIKELETQKVDLTEYAKKTDIPDITVNNGSAESGKYISQIAVDATDKHKLIVTKADLPQGFSGDYNDLTNKPTIPTLRPTIELEVASLTTLTEAEKLAIRNTLNALIVNDKIDGTKFDDIVLVTTNDLIRLHYSSIDYYVANPQITVIFETESTKYILHVPVIDYTYSTLTSTTTYTKTEIDAMIGDIETLLGGI